jgi:hypothetical protein
MIVYDRTLFRYRRIDGYGTSIPWIRDFPALPTYCAPDSHAVMTVVPFGCISSWNTATILTRDASFSVESVMK